MGITFRSDKRDPNNILVLFESRGYELRSRPVRDTSNISFVVVPAYTFSFVKKYSTRLIKLQDELSVLIGAKVEIQQGDRVTEVRVLTTSLGVLLQLLSVSDRIKLLFHESGAVRSLLSSYALKHLTKGG